MLRQACTPKCILGCKSKVPRVSLGELKIDRPEGGARVSELFLCRSCSPPSLPSPPSLSFHLGWSLFPPAGELCRNLSSD